MRPLSLLLLFYSSLCFAPAPNRNYICSYNLYLFNGVEDQFKKIEQTLKSVGTGTNDNFFYHFQEVISEKGLAKVSKLEGIKIVNKEIPLVSAQTTNFPLKQMSSGVIKGQFRRGMLYSEFKFEESKLYLINCHWPSQYHHFSMRVSQAKLLKQFITIKLARDPHAKFLVTGDFNLKKKEIFAVQDILRPYLVLLKNRGSSAGTFYYSKRSQWNNFDLIWSNFNSSQFTPKIIVRPVNSTLAKNKKNEFFLRPKKFYSSETHFDRQGPSDHFPLCMSLPI